MKQISATNRSPTTIVDLGRLTPRQSLDAQECTRLFLPPELLPNWVLVGQAAAVPCVGLVRLTRPKLPGRERSIACKRAEIARRPRVGSYPRHNARSCKCL